MVALALVSCSTESRPVAPQTAVPPSEPAVTPVATRSAQPGRDPRPESTQRSGRTSGEFDASVPPDAPAELDGPPSEDSAVAVASYYMSLFPYVFASTDTSRWDELAGPRCSFCANVSEMVAGLAAKGERRQGGEITVSWAQGFDHRSDVSQYAVSLAFSEQPSRVLDPDGAITDRSPDQVTAKAQILLTWDGEAWVIDGVDITVVDRS